MRPSQRHPSPDLMAALASGPPESDPGRGPVERAARAVGVAVVLGADPATASHAVGPDAPVHLPDIEAPLAGDLQNLRLVCAVGRILPLAEVRGGRLRHGGCCDNRDEGQPGEERGPAN
jgi:hypothetical protein